MKRLKSHIRNEVQSARPHKGLRTRQHKFLGEEEALRLTDWLNSNQGSAHYKRVVRILEAILKIDEAMVGIGQVKVEDRGRITADGEFRLLGTRREFTLEEKPKPPGPSSVPNIPAGKYAWAEPDETLDKLNMWVNRELER